MYSAPVIVSTTADRNVGESISSRSLGATINRCGHGNVVGSLVHSNEVLARRIEGEIKYRGFLRLLMGLLACLLVQTSPHLSRKRSSQESIGKNLADLHTNELAVMKSYWYATE